MQKIMISSSLKRHYKITTSSFSEGKHVSESHRPCTYESQHYIQIKQNVGTEVSLIVCYKIFTESWWLTITPPIGITLRGFWDVYLNNKTKYEREY